MKRREPDQEQASRTGEKMRDGAQHGTNRLEAFLSNQVEARKVTEEESNHPEMKRTVVTRTMMRKIVYTMAALSLI